MEDNIVPNDVRANILNKLLVSKEEEVKKINSSI